MRALSSLLIGFAGRAAARRFDRATRDPAGAQHAKLMQIVQRNRDTAYGRKHGFASVQSLADWQTQVPVINYDVIADLMRRVVNGEKNVLTAEDPVMFARTSGTTGDAKYIPITPTCQSRDHSDQGRTWAYHVRKDHPEAFRGRIVTLVSPAVEGYTPAGIPYGSTSGHIYKTMPHPVQSLYAVPYEVFEIEDYQSKYYVLMLLSIATDVSLVCTANPSSIVKMCEVADANADALLEDIGRGRAREDLALPDATRAIVDARLRPDPRRATRLADARRRRGGRLLPADYWPRLGLIGCWKGGTVSAYLDRFPEWFDPDGTRAIPVRDWGYLSSEARGSIPLTDVGCGGVLTVATNVYEFVDVEQVEASPDDWRSWDFLGVSDVEPGREYYIFFTTTGGLYRYDINDVIRVVDRHHETPVIVFRRKGRGMTNITGEKISVNQIIEVFERTSRELRVPVEHFKAEADIDASRYVFKMEVSEPVPEDLCATFLQGLDRSLAELNIEYAAKRKSFRLDAPQLLVMKAGWYDFNKRRQIARTGRDFQAKTALLGVKEPAAAADPGGSEDDFVLTVVTMKD